MGKKEKEDRLLFEYYNGEKKVKADPAQIYRDLLDDPEFDFIGELAVLSELNTPELIGETRERILCLICKAFKITEFDGDKGLTETEMLALGEAYLAFLHEFKKKLWLWPTRWLLTALESLEEDQQSESDSPSSCTEEESKPEEPTSTAEPWSQPKEV